MAGVLVDDAQRTRRRSRLWLGDLAQVADARSERASAIRPHGIFREHLAVRLEVCTAARGVHDDRHVRSRERVDVEAGELARAFTVSRVRVERAAADLLLRRGDPLT